MKKTRNCTFLTLFLPLISHCAILRWVYTAFFKHTVKSKGLRWQKAEFVLFQATLLYSFLCQAVFVLPEVISVFGFVGFDPDPEQLAIVDVESVKKKNSQFSTEMKHHNTENLLTWACRVWGSIQALQVCYYDHTPVI